MNPCKTTMICYEWFRFEMRLKWRLFASQSKKRFIDIEDFPRVSIEELSPKTVWGSFGRFWDLNVQGVWRIIKKAGNLLEISKKIVCWGFFLFLTKTETFGETFSLEVFILFLVDKNEDKLWFSGRKLIWCGSQKTSYELQEACQTRNLTLFL